MLTVATVRAPGATFTLEIDNEIYFGGHKGEHTYPYVLRGYSHV